MRPARRRGASFPPTVAQPTARLALHHLLKEAHTGIGDAREEIKLDLAGDVRPVAVKMTSLRMFVETTRTWRNEGSTSVSGLLTVDSSS